MKIDYDTMTPLIGLGLKRNGLSEITLPSMHGDIYRMREKVQDMRVFGEFRYMNTMEEVAMRIILPIDVQSMVIREDMKRLIQWLSKAERGPLSDYVRPTRKNP
jgi:hypothetical protein